MKKNVAFIQNAILNEIMKEYTTRDIADATLTYLNKLTDADLAVYSTYDDAITFRKNKEATVTDNDILKALSKGVQSIVSDFDDLPDILADVYDCKYNEKYLSMAYFTDIIIIRHSGRLIRVEIDVH